ncbi:hypothetical protein NJO91_13125 [Streptomyces microflavus]|uniref:hypothetical protein n=1 Tax=Streptomyces microflavus TaxID=1919 RepID=UPI0029B19D2B|nr:hypothetical protein [Streptomyces microflavus]MDX2404062.1 hypothetical protein [Streptomyces microflavus]
MEIGGVVAVLVLLLVPSLQKLLNSVAYRNRARGQAEIIRARHSAQLQTPPDKQKKGKAHSRV